MGNLALDIGLRSLLNASAHLDTIGHNLANASTPGYSRQGVLSSQAGALNLRGLVLGAGVRADVVQRTSDQLLHQRIVRQGSSLARLDARLAVLGDAESLLGGSGDQSLNALARGLFGALSSLSATPQDSALRGGVVQAASQLADRFGQLARGVEDLRAGTLSQLRAQTNQANTLARRIHELNSGIADAEAGGAPANDLRDQRDEAVRQLSALVDVRALEEPDGSLRVLVGGHLLVSRHALSTLGVEEGKNGKLPALRVQGSSAPLQVTGGSLGAGLGLLADFLPRLGRDLDTLARNLALEMNRVHAVGLPSSGPFQALTAQNGFSDRNGDGSVLDERIGDAGLPFDLRKGELHVTLTDRVSGALTRQRLDLDPAATTVADLLAAFNGIPGLSASLDAGNRLRIQAAPGLGFDFSPRLDPQPDKLGSFGGGQASLATATAGPFAIAAGDTLDLSGPQGPFTVTFQSGAFQQNGAATAAELAAALNADAGMQANGLTASAVAGRLVIQTAGAGPGESFALSGGSALAALGPGPQTVSGHATSVDVRLWGTYSGSKNQAYTFQALGDGTIGTTAGLRVQVLDAAGAQVALLDVGAGYQPGDELEVTAGLRVSFGVGELSASHGDVFAVDALASSDTTDALAAMGLNALFVGADAASLAVRADIVADPRLLAAALTSAPGDNANLLRMLALDAQGLQGLGGATFSERSAQIAGGVGLEIATAADARDAEGFLLDTLVARRDQLSGVNPDEELVNMMQQEQAYAAAGQYLRVVSDLQQELMRILS